MIQNPYLRNNNVMTFKISAKHFPVQCHLFDDCCVMKLTAGLIDSHSQELRWICYGAFPDDSPSPITLLTFWLPWLFFTPRLLSEGQS